MSPLPLCTPMLGRISIIPEQPGWHVLLHGIIAIVEALKGQLSYFSNPFLTTDIKTRKYYKTMFFRFLILKSEKMVITGFLKWVPSFPNWVPGFPKLGQLLYLGVKILFVLLEKTSSWASFIRLDSRTKKLFYIFVHFQVVSGGMASQRIICRSIHLSH